MDITNDIVFVYRKNDKIEVLKFSEAVESHFDLISKGFVHTETLNTIEYIKHKIKSEYLINLNINKNDRK